jgi:RNA polymerase sigma factor (sigma-70 family)
MAEANGHPGAMQLEGTATGDDAKHVARAAALYETHGEELRRFVFGVTRDHDLAGDVLQATFAKAVEQGHTARDETFKGWLFRVAFHEALTARRRRETRNEGNRRLAAMRLPAEPRPEETLIRNETAAAVREALAGLPEEQRKVVRARIYDEKPFAEIARELGLPLGTVLTRMRLALEKLRRALGTGD